MKIRPVGAELLPAEGRMNGQKNMPKLIIALRNFVNAPEKGRVFFFSKLQISYTSYASVE
jgi:hypothetical protein